jgi:choline dehydrogenase
VETIEADCIVVGAGSAGCVIAARLSEDPSCRVVVLEAGGEDRNPWIHIPLGYGKTITDARVNWCYHTEPDPGLNGRSVFWPRGKVLGGSSSINGLLYIRGQAEDFAHWRQLGNVGWSFEDVLPYFKRSEGRIGGAGRADDDLHGHDGPLAVSDLGDRNALSEAYIQAAQALGIPRNDDFSGRVQEGVGYFQVTARRGRRCSAAVAFLRPAMKRPNLRVVTHALAGRVLFAGRRATGVSFLRDGVAHTVRATREVILAGGAVNSPQLLMLSGIGPAAHLQGMGVETIHDLPGVGRNLQDHFQTRFAYRCRFPITVNDVMMSRLKMARMGLQYVLFRNGPLAVSAGQVGLFAKTRPDLPTPDIQFHYVGFSSDRPTEGLHKYSGFSQSVCQLRPESRGWITLKSTNPAAPPAIHPNYLATELDRRTLVDGLKLGRRIAAQPALQHFIASEDLPGGAVQSDDQLLDYARHYGGTIYHPAGTCKMGHDALAVVDDQLRVHGLTGLRVADASIMPTVVSGNTNAACIMIGEKCADLVRGQVLARAA